MKVACPNCGQPQETAVDPMVGASRARCAQCGTSFLVRVKQKQKPDSNHEDEKGYAWFVRKPDGTVFSFPGDRQLHDGIRRGFVALVDEISADSVKWTTIQALPVLAAFMQQKTEPEAQEPSRTAKEAQQSVAAKVRLDSPQAPTLEVPEQPGEDARSLPTVAMNSAAGTDPVPAPDAIPAQPLAPAEVPQVALTPTPSLTSRPIERSEKDDPEWAGEWDKRQTDPEDMTGLTLHIRKRRQYLALAVVGALMLLVGLIAVRYIFFTQPTERKALAGATQEPTRSPRSPAPDAAATLGIPDVSAPSLDALLAPDLTPDLTPEDAITQDSIMADVPSDAAPTSDITSQSDTADSGQLPEVSSADVAATRPEVTTAAAAAVADVVAAPAALTLEAPVAKAAKPEEKSVTKVDRQQRKERHRESRTAQEEPAPPAKSRHDDEEDVSGSYDSLMSKGEKYRKNGDMGKAIKVFEKARSLKPTYAEPNYKLAECYRLTGKCGSAVTYYDKSIVISGFRNAYIGIAKCYRQMGETAKARKYLEKGIEKYNDGIMKLMLEKL